MTQEKYLKTLWLLENLIDNWLFQRRHCYHFTVAIPYQLDVYCFDRLVGKFRKVYRNYQVWCRRHHEPCLWVRTGNMWGLWHLEDCI